MIAGFWPDGAALALQDGKAVAATPLETFARRLESAGPDDSARYRVAARRLGLFSGRDVDVHLPGPATALATTAAHEDATADLWRVPGLRPIAADYVARLAAALVRTGTERGAKVRVVLDEPSAAPPKIDVDNPANLLLWSRIVEDVAGVGGRVGMHACGEPPVDLLLHLDFDLFSVDARRYADALRKRRRTLDRYLRRGGSLALGVFDARDLADDVDSAVALVRSIVDGDGTNVLLTPACGTGRSTPARERAVAAALALLRTRLLGDDA